MFQPSYWAPEILEDPVLIKIRRVEDILVKTPTEFIKKELRLHINKALVEQNEFTQALLSKKSSYNSLVRIITKILSWRYDKLEAREKAEKYLLDSTRPDSKQIQDMGKKFQIDV